MYFTPTIFIAQLLAAMQVLMTLDMPLSTTMALPVTSKPIESTVENLAWQAWIELPPEQKQQVKSRKVTPKSIFTLPLRVECPQGHKQVDSKCIPIAIGSNDVLIDLNALGLLVGNSHTDDIYDYDDLGDEEMGSSLPYASDMPPGESEKSVEGITVELKPPTKDEPLKFNIFENKFNIFHEEPMEDYTALSNEGGQPQSSEKDQGLKNETFAEGVNVTAINDLLSEASNISENNFEIYVQKVNESQANATSYDKLEGVNTLTTLANEEEFKIDAISVPAAGFDTHNPNVLSVIQNDSSIQLVTSIMESEPTTLKEEKQEVKENDLQTLLQTESLLPLMQQATATTLQAKNKIEETAAFSLVKEKETSETLEESLKLNIDEEMTTLPSVMDSDLKQEKSKQEFTRSVTMLPLIANESDNEAEGDDVVKSEDNDDADVVTDTTLTIETSDEPLETTTPIQLDDTTIIETSSSLSTTPATQQQQQMELKDLLMQQEQAQKDFEELQRMRKGQKDQKLQQQHQQNHIVLKKSKVEPVEIVANTKATISEETETTTNNNFVRETTTLRSTEELLTAAASSSSVAFAAETAETVTPLLTVHDKENNDNNDRFYYQHFGKQDLEETQLQQQQSSSAIPTKATLEETVTTLTSETDLAEELRLINELVKGIKPATTLTTIKTMQTSTTTTSTSTTSSTTTTTTEKPTTKTLTEEESSSSSMDLVSESSLEETTKTTPSTLQIWSKIMPLLTTSSTTQTTPKHISDETLLEGQESNDIPTTATTTDSLTSPRSNRNSKIIRLNNFNTVTARKMKPLSESSSTTTTTASTLLETEESSSSSSSSSSSDSSATENNTYEPYWWLPVAWRLDKPTSTSEKPLDSESQVKTEEQPLLLRFWSAYHAPKTSS